MAPMCTTLCLVLNILYFYISTFRSICAASNMAVFCSSLISCFPGVLLRYFLDDFEIVPAVSIIADITFVFTFHMRCISIVRSLYFRIYSASFFITFLFPKTATSITIHVPFHYHGLWCLVCCWRRFCRFAFVDSIIWLPGRLHLFVLILVHVRTSVLRRCRY